ncbi:hypothetical protein JCM10295v2_005080 [Rhodotorula toruloides]
MTTTCFTPAAGACQTYARLTKPCHRHEGVRPPLHLRLKPTAAPSPPASKRRKVLPPSSVCLCDRLPVEIVELVVSYLDLEDLGRLRRANRQFRDLLAKPHLYHTVSLTHIPHVHPQLLAFLPLILSGTRHLSLRSFPSTLISHLLPNCSDRLVTLDLSFSGVTDSDLLLVAATTPSTSESALSNLQSLRLKGCRRISSVFAVLCSSSDPSQLPALRALESLDLSWSSTSSLPLPLSSRLPSLRHLNLSTTPYLAPDHLTQAVCDLPHGLESLDLSHLWLSAADLSGLAFAPLIPPSPSLHSISTTSPRTLHLILTGNDSLTLSSLSHLKSHWSRLCSSRRIEIEHSPMLLESDEEEDVRRFVEMVAGVVMRGSEVQGRASSGGNGSGSIGEERGRRSL